MGPVVACKICDSPAQPFGTQRVLGKYDATYLRCGACGYLWVLAPTWLEEAYSQAIAALDTGIVVRNMWLADACCALLGTSLRDARSILDYGGGSGLLVRTLRDRGHEAWWQDAYCPNLLAVGFESPANASYDLLTAFELVEHLPDPMEWFQRARSISPRLLISTDLQPADLDPGMQWRYMAPESGQHIGFFTRRSLEIVAERLGLVLSSNDRNLHLLADKRISERWLRALRKPSGARRWAWLGRRPSLTYVDADRMLERVQRLQGSTDGTGINSSG